MAGMTPRQQRFVDEYLVDLNATQAAIRAGYSERRAERAGYELVINREVAAEIATRQQAVAIRMARSQDDVATRLADIAWTDMTDIAEWGDERFVLRDSDELSDNVRAAVKTLKVKRRTEVTGSRGDRHVWLVESIEVGLDDRIKAAELYGRHIGMWPREAPQVNIDARSITLGSDIIEAVGGVDGLRRLALPPGDDDDE